MQTAEITLNSGVKARLQFWDGQISGIGFYTPSGAPAWVAPETRARFLRAIKGVSYKSLADDPEAWYEAQLDKRRRYDQLLLERSSKSRGMRSMPGTRTLDLR